MQPMQLFIISGLTALVLGFPMQGLSEDSSIEIALEAKVGCRSPEEPALLCMLL
jgi:hypothetical protein